VPDHLVLLLAHTHPKPTMPQLPFLETRLLTLPPLETRQLRQKQKSLFDLIKISNVRPSYADRVAFLQNVPSGHLH
jgi:hypothetical protein